MCGLGQAVIGVTLGGLNRISRHWTGLRDVMSEGVDNVVDDFWGQRLITAFAHDADHRLGLRRPYH